MRFTRGSFLICSPFEYRTRADSRGEEGESKLKEVGEEIDEEASGDSCLTSGDDSGVG